MNSNSNSNNNNNNNTNNTNINNNSESSESVYYELVGEKFHYFVKTLQLQLGRSADNNENILSEYITSNTAGLGNSKLISRHHITIQWNPDNGVWQLMIIGRNGVLVDSHYYKLGYSSSNSPSSISPIHLPYNRPCPIKVGDCKFWFNPVKI